MKTKSNQKLKLSRETIRTLTAADLANVGGGIYVSNMQTTCISATPSCVR